MFRVAIGFFRDRIRGMTETRSNLASLYRLARWIVLIVLIFVIIVALKKPAPPASPQDAQQARQNAASFTEKLDQLESARSRGESSEARFSSDEVNATIAQSISPSTPHPPELSPPSPSTPPKPLATPSAEGDTPGPISTVQVAFLGDQVIGQFATEVYGKQMYITVAGKLGSKDGYVTFEPSAFRVGDLSVPVSLVNGQLQAKLIAPENREKLKLPDFVSDLRIEDGQLVVVEK